MDDVARVISELREDPVIRQARFSGLVHDVADVVEKHGLATARVFLIDRKSRGELRRQAEALLCALDIIEKYPGVASDLKTVRLIIKTIDAIKKGGSHDR